MTVLSKLIYIFNTIPTKVPAAFLGGRNWQANSKTHMEVEETQNNQNNLEKEE